MAIATQPYDGRDKCINLGACGQGCAQGAKASTDITYWPHAIRAGVELRTRCRVREVTTDENGLATGAVYYDEAGQEQHLAVREFDAVLAVDTHASFEHVANVQPGSDRDHIDVLVAKRE